MNDLLRKKNDQPTNNIDVSCVQTVGLKHANGLFVLLEINFFAFEAKSILDNLCPIVEQRYWKLFETHYNANGENEGMEEVDMDGNESDQELTGNETDQSK